jgi:hypothetical protein
MIELIVSSTTKDITQQDQTSVEEVCEAANPAVEKSSSSASSTTNSSSEEDDEEDDDEEQAQGGEDDKAEERLRIRVLQSRKTVGLEKVARFEEKLKRWIGCCSICTAGENKEERKHRWEECEMYGAAIGNLKSWIRNMETVRPDRDSNKNNGRRCCCLPEQVCRYEGIGGKCRWEGVVARVAMSLLFYGPAEVRA